MQYIGSVGADSSLSLSAGASSGGVRFQGGAKRTSSNVLSLSGVSGDKGTKSRAVTAFAMDPSMSKTLSEIHDTDESAELAARMSRGSPAERGQREARRRRMRGELDVKGPGRDVGQAVAAGIAAPDRASEAAAGRRYAKRGSSSGTINEYKLQQLRGIFAAFDENDDGVLTKECVVVPLHCAKASLC